MKKKILGLAFLLTAAMSAQRQDYFIAYNLDDWGAQLQKKATSRIVDTEAKYIVEFTGKSANEIYQGTEMAIGETWKNPDEVIAGSSEDKYIKINGGALERGKYSMLLASYDSTKLSIIIKFKEGKLMYQILSYKGVRLPTEYTSGGDYIVVEKLTKKSGKKYKFGQQNVDTFNGFINGFIDEIKKQVQESSSNSNSDW